MFERYTEKARRVIFFSRYEASQYGSPYIETEHLLLGLLREDKALTNRFLRSHANVEKIRKQIEAHTTFGEKILTSVDLPMSNECKRVLAYAAEEAERLGHKHIGTEHLLLGLLREEGCFAAALLNERGLKLDEVRQQLPQGDHEMAPGGTGGSGAGHAGEPVATSPRYFRDLTQEAIDGALAPVVGRGLELDAIIEILAASRNRNPLLVGEPGAGKSALVEALARRISENAVPPFLAEKRVMALEGQQMKASPRERLQVVGEMNKALDSLTESSPIILFVGNLIISPTCDPVLAQIAPLVLKPDAVKGNVQCIASCTPAEYREIAQSGGWLTGAFRAIHVRPLSEDETLEALKARKSQLGELHEVGFEDSAFETAARSSSRYLADRVLPGKAFELLDAAAARVKVAQTANLPQEILDTQKRIRHALNRVDGAIANHEFEKARYYSDEEKKERDNLRTLGEKYHVDAASAVRSDDVEAMIERWSQYPFQP